jgi:hypothetical protein
MKQNQRHQECISPRDASLRKQLSHRVRNSWVNCVLNQQQCQQEDNRAFCTLNLYSQREQRFLHPYYLLVSTGHFIKILGGPGMGKTMLLAQLVQHTSSHLPLFLDLSEWSPHPHQTLTDWIVKKTNRFYQISGLDSNCLIPINGFGKPHARWWGGEWVGRSLQ